MGKTEIIYKICQRSLWQEAQNTGQFDGAPIDLEDGYIHFSTSKQVVETARKHFKGQDDLLLLSISVQVLEDCPHDVKWEPSRGGDLFPHLYGPMPLDAVVKSEELAMDAEGYHLFPASLAQ